MMLLARNIWCHKEAARYLVNSRSYSSNSTVRDLYGILGVSPSSDLDQIKQAYYQKAKQLHPDKQIHAGEKHQGRYRHQFLEVKIAYEILSNVNFRKQYDQEYETRNGRCTPKTAAFYQSSYPRTEAKSQLDAAIWIRDYRNLINRLVHEQRVNVLASSRGSIPSYFDSKRTEIESEFIGALKTAYFGPPLDGSVFANSTLPDSFEAEERSCADSSDVLHLVHGRQMLGLVREKCLKSLEPSDGLQKWIGSLNADDMAATAVMAPDSCLELEIHGKVVAVAVRDSVHRHGSAVDRVSVFDWPLDAGSVRGSSSTVLGRIYGLGDVKSGVCEVESRDGAASHSVVLHTTPLVRHMLWYRHGSDRKRCECRARRAWLPPSRYWLFEPRLPTHDIGGWQFELFGNTAVGLNPYSRMFYQPARSSAGMHGKSIVDIADPMRLHPSVYVFGAAYKSLDEERRLSIKNPLSLFALLKSWKEWL